MGKNKNWLTNIWSKVQDTWKKIDHKWQKASNQAIADIAEARSLGSDEYSKNTNNDLPKSEL